MTLPRTDSRFGRTSSRLFTTSFERLDFAESSNSGPEVKEEELIPYAVSDLVAERILVLSAHPDDETLGAGGAIALNTRKGATVRIWIATDGERQEGTGSAAADAGRRRDEARVAAAALGAAPPVFGGLPDRSLDSSGDALARALAQEIS